MSATGPPDIPGDAGAAPGASSVVQAAGRHRQRSRCQARARHGVRWDVGGLESSRGVWVTDVHAQVTRATPATGIAISTAESEAWCAKPLPKQDKQTCYRAVGRVLSRFRTCIIALSDVCYRPPTSCTLCVIFFLILHTRVEHASWWSLVVSQASTPHCHP